MIFDNYYIQVDLKNKIFLNNFGLLPKNWKNISCFSSLSDEELEDLTWSGNDGIGWIKFTSPKIKDFSATSDNFLYNKVNLKKDISDAIDDSINTRIVYKTYEIRLNDELKNVLTSRYLHSLSDESITLKIDCMGNYRTFNAEEIKELILMIDRKDLSIYNKKIELYEMIDSSKSIYELTQKQYII
jgi:hypothetical protein